MKRSRLSAEARRSLQAKIVVGAWWAPLTFASDVTRRKDHGARQIASVSHEGVDTRITWAGGKRAVSGHTLLHHWRPCDPPAVAAAPAPKTAPKAAPELTPMLARAIVDAALDAALAAAMPRIRAECLAAVREAFK